MVKIMPRPRRIYDSFLFDGELDLLEFRLRQNYDETDFFVLVEAGETYRGQTKSLKFAENCARFAWAADKIVPVQLKALGSQSSNPRQRAAVQRNAILLALADALPEDIVLLLDADEVPSVSLLRRLRIQEIHEPYRMEMTRHYQSLNLLAPASTCCIDQAQPFSFAAERIRLQSWNTLPARWSGRSGVAVPVGFFRETGHSPYNVRYSGQIRLVLKDAGRHLTAADPSAFLSRKLGRVFHAEWATERGMYPPHLELCREHAIHHRGWWYAEQVPGALPEDLRRLAAACPSILRSRPMPSMGRRRLVRTWAWLRQWSMFPDTFVCSIDDRFEQLLPLLFAPLLIADLARFLAAKFWIGKAKRSLDERAYH
jgi:beta-1,4-mannosyl-glycoprotein beta-1,4-N-acetylglucosaminyltransferase